MKYAIVFCLLLVALCYASKECGENEVFNSCGSTCIPNEPSCRPRPIADVPCPAVCSPTCDCASGYLRHHSGKCVTKENC
ncbi:PREDICTED: chymotrypsin inhibitor-like [Nicrophorus vespilloides]|uniref:Chymotrypsin inhibitor-like n=1 Tax=Nicrophorus vespilloides TaxID=110193 RepID=A0ABM1NJJ8_NICVS|nr:PREDICTED: chymotrypsin inhibitor-like [Nicrophorus vespilloides]